MITPIGYVTPESLFGFRNHYNHRDARIQQKPPANARQPPEDAITLSFAAKRIIDQAERIKNMPLQKTE